MSHMQVDLLSRMLRGAVMSLMLTSRFYLASFHMEFHLFLYADYWCIMPNKEKPDGVIHQRACYFLYHGRPHSGAEPLKNQLGAIFKGSVGHKEQPARHVVENLFAQ